MRRSSAAAALALTLGLASWVTPAAGHDFPETRRLVLSAEPDGLALLVAYELRPGRLADGLWARFDAGPDGRVGTAWERLARARVIAPRVGGDIEVTVDGAPARLALVDLQFPDPPVEGGRPGVAAIGLYRIPVVAAEGPTRLTIGVRRGGATLEAQAVAPWQIRADGLPRRAGDPVLGPGPLSAARPAELSLQRVAAP